MTARDRLERAAAFVAQLHRLSVKTRIPGGEPKASVAMSALRVCALDQAIRDAEQAGLIERRADDQGLIILTAEGRAAASQQDHRCRRQAAARCRASASDGARCRCARSNRASHDAAHRYTVAETSWNMRSRWARVDGYRPGTRKYLRRGQLPMRIGHAHRHVAGVLHSLRSRHENCRRPDAAIHLVGHRLPAIAHRRLGGAKCRATNVVTSEGNIGVFRQWAAFGTSRDGYYAHLFLWGGPEQFLLSFRRRDDGRLREGDIRAR